MKNKTNSVCGRESIFVTKNEVPHVETKAQAIMKAAELDVPYVMVDGVMVPNRKLFD